MRKLHFLFVVTVFPWVPALQDKYGHQCDPASRARLYTVESQHWQEGQARWQAVSWPGVAACDF